MHRLSATPLLRWAAQTARSPPTEITLNAFVVLAGAGCPVTPFAALTRAQVDLLP